MKNTEATITYNKLVADKIPKKIRKNGGKCKVRILTQEGLKNILPSKLKEEVDELRTANTRESRLLEAADVIQVTTDLLWVNNLSIYDCRKEQQNFRLTVPQSFKKLIKELQRLALELEESYNDRGNTLKILAAVVQITLVIINLDEWNHE